jgi:uncharacterized membrane protein YcaP (DUF421 family)
VLHLTVAWWELALRAIVVYVVLLLGLRLFGKREVGQFTLFDLVLVLLVANAVQPAITGPDTSLAGGLVIIAALLATNFVVARLDQVPFLRGVLQPMPATIVYDGHFIASRMRREGLDEDEVLSAVREHGLDKLEDVHLAVLEPDGSISVVPKETSGKPRPRRRSRYARRG